MTALPSTAKMVGPIIRGVEGTLADAVIAAIDRDNPDAEVIVDDQGGYIRIAVEDRCVLTRSSLEDELGKSFALSELEPALAAFAGRVKQSDTEMIWYLERKN